MSNLDIIKPTVEHTATLIFLHGSGQNGAIWTSKFKSIQLPYLKIICPNAPKKPLTCKRGFPTTIWFDVLQLSPGPPENEKEIVLASKNIHKIIEDEIKLGIPSERIILGGFSQGGSLAIHSFITFPKKIGGVCVFSVWMLMKSSFPKNFVGNKSTPILMCHGDNDQLVSHSFGVEVRETLEQVLTNIEFKTYPGLIHDVCQEEIQELKNFIVKVLNE